MQQRGKLSRILLLMFEDQGSSKTEVQTRQKTSNAIEDL